jgi:hypothetical protein
MPSRYYTALLFVGGSAALFGLGSLFGLGLLSAPSAPRHETIAIDHKPAKLDKKAKEARRKADARLSPVYPANPGATGQQSNAPKQTAHSDAKQPVNSGAKQTANSARAETSEAKPPSRAQQGTTGASSADEEADSSSAPTSASAQQPAHCAVRACEAAYRSFRASDCTYQPYTGPRQLCTKPPTPYQRQAVRWRDRDAAPPDEDSDLDGAVAAVRRMTPDFEGSDSEPPPPQRRAIVIDR